MVRKERKATAMEVMVEKVFADDDLLLLVLAVDVVVMVVVVLGWGVEEVGLRCV